MAFDPSDTDTQRVQWHVALFAFDEYAQHQARAPYSEAHVQRSTRKDDPYWFCTATLPFNPEYLLTLRLKRYSLRPVLGRPRGAFLVTSIIAAKPGQPLPRLAFARANDGKDAPDVVEVNAPKPYGGKEGRDRKNPTGARSTAIMPRPLVARSPGM